MEWNSLWRCVDWQSCPSVGNPRMHPHVIVSLSHLPYVTHLSHGHEWASSHRHWTVPPSDLQTWKKTDILQKGTEAAEWTETANNFISPVVMAACEMFACTPTQAGKATLFSVFLRRSTSVVLTSIMSSYSYTLVGTVQKAGEVAASFKEEIKWANIPWGVDSHLFGVGSIARQLEHQGCRRRRPPQATRHRPRRSCSCLAPKHTDPHICTGSLSRLGNKLNIKIKCQKREKSCLKS